MSYYGALVVAQTSFTNYPPVICLSYSSQNLDITNNSSFIPKTKSLSSPFVRLVSSSSALFWIHVFPSPHLLLFKPSSHLKKVSLLAFFGLFPTLQPAWELTRLWHLELEGFPWLPIFSISHVQEFSWALGSVNRTPAYLADRFILLPSLLSSLPYSFCFRSC